MSMTAAVLLKAHGDRPEEEFGRARWEQPGEGAKG
jgi:hypothetical protein